MENVTKLLESAVALVAALSWPLLIVFLVYYFGKPLKKFIENMGEVSFKAGPTGLEASAKIQELKEKLSYADPNTTSDFTSETGVAESSMENSREGRIKHRHKIEETTKEIYLVHVIEPSERRGQKFDVFIYLKRHRSDDLSEISYAEFFLGSLWNNNIYRVENTDGLIGVSISAYGPVLCTCRVVFNKGYETKLYRYIDFEMADALNMNEA